MQSFTVSHFGTANITTQTAILQIRSPRRSPRFANKYENSKIQQNLYCIIFQHFAFTLFLSPFVSIHKLRFWWYHAEKRAAERKFGSSFSFRAGGEAERPVQVMAKTTAGCRLARRRSGAVSAVCSAYMREIYYLCGDMGDILLNTLFAAYGMDWDFDMGRFARG